MHVDEATLQEALERCAELSEERRSLLRAQAEVRKTIARFSSAFANDGIQHNSDSLEDNSESDGDESGQEEDESDFDDEARSLDTYQNVLARREELEDEVESLREALDTVASSIASIAEQSYQLSDDLQEVQDRMHLPTDAQNTVVVDSTTFGFNSGAMTNVAQCSKLKLDSLPPLCLPVAPGNTTKLGIASSEASSSTATPRSDTASESMMASARSDDCGLVRSLEVSCP